MATKKYKIEFEIEVDDSIAIKGDILKIAKALGELIEYKQTKTPNVIELNQIFDNIKLQEDLRKYWEEQKKIERPSSDPFINNWRYKEKNTPTYYKCSAPDSLTQINRTLNQIRK